MTIKRKPTLKQLFIVWKKHQKKSAELRKINSELSSICQQVGYSDELIRDGDYLYRVRSRGRYGSYEVEQVASTEELNNIK
jgi:hypothetical protein